MALFLPVYFSLIPVILIAGIVLAVKRRHLIGARASNQLAAGAGLLLLVHVFTLLRPLLRNAIAQQGDGPFSSGEIVAGLVSLPVLLQAVGIGLIIAAVITPRPPTQASDQASQHDDAQTASQLPVDNRPPPTRSKWTMAGAAAVVAVIAVAAVAWIRYTPPLSDIEIQRVAEQRQAERCLDQYLELNLPVKAKPVERMMLRSNDSWLRIYASELDNWINACVGGPEGVRQSFGTLMGQGSADKLRFFGGYDSVLKARLLLGHLPTGGTSVEARLTNGQIIRGDHDSDFFVIWEPGISVDGAQVTVSTQDGVVIATANAPTEQD